MKTIKKIDKEIKETYDFYSDKIEDAIKNNKNTDRLEAKKDKEIEFFKFCKEYLKYNPNPEFIKSEFSRIKAKIKLIKSRYEVWLNNTPEAFTVKNPEQKYKTEMGLSKLNKQLKTLDYLLED